MSEKTPDPNPRIDPFLDEVRRLKREAFARSGDDLDRHFQRLREIQRKHPGGVVASPTDRKPTPWDVMPPQAPSLDTLKVDHPSSIVVVFVPSEDLSTDAKLTVTIPIKSVEGRQVQNRLDEFQILLSLKSPVDRIVHGNGSDFTIILIDGSTQALLDPGLDSGLAHHIYDGLQDIAHAAESAYRIVQANLSRTA